MPVERVWNNVFGLDWRSIYLFRFFLGFLLIYNLIVYKIASFYTIFAPQSGFLGNDFINTLKVNNPVSFLKYIESDNIMLFFFLFSCICYLFYAFNFKPLLTSILAYFCYTAISLRYFPIRAGWDYYIDVLLFLSIFLSIGKSKASTFEHRGIFAFLIIFQIGIIYLFAALSKFGINWQNGTAVSYILGDKTLNTSLGQWLLLNAPIFLIKMLTYSTLVWEFLLFFLLFIPFKSQKIRLSISISIILFHWSINLFADVGHFKYISTCAAILLLPTIFWDFILSKKKAFSNKINYLFNKINGSEKVINQYSFGFFSKLIAIYFVFAILFSNIIFSLQARKIIEPNNKTINSLRLFFPRKSYFFSQNWAMYSPNPMNEWGVLKMEGTTLNGRKTNLLNQNNAFNDLSKKDFNVFFMENQLLTIFKSKITQGKDDEIIKRWFQCHLNKYYENKSLPKLKVANLYLYSINGNDFLKNGNAKVIKKEIIKADIQN